MVASLNNHNSTEQVGIFAPEEHKKITSLHISKLGLDNCKAKKLTKELNTHTLYTICNTNYQNQEEAGFPPR